MHSESGFFADFAIFFLTAALSDSLQSEIKMAPRHTHCPVYVHAACPVGGAGNRTTSPGVYGADANPSEPDVSSSSFLFFFFLFLFYFSSSFSFFKFIYLSLNHLLICLFIILKEERKEGRKGRK